MVMIINEELSFGVGDVSNVDDDYLDGYDLSMLIGDGSDDDGDITGNVAWSRSKTLVPAQCINTSWTSILVFGQLDYGDDDDNDNDNDNGHDEDYSKTCDITINDT